MGDSEGPFTEQSRLPVVVSQTGTVSNSSINNSQISIVNNISVYFLGNPQPEQVGPCSRPQHEATRVQHDGTGVQHDGTGVQHEGTGVQHEGTRVVREGTGVQHEGTGVQHEDTGVQHEATGVQHEGTGVEHEGTGVQHEDTGVQHEGTGVEHEGTGVQHEGTGVQHEGTGVQHEDTRPQHEDTGQQPEEDEKNGDSDEHKELRNSLTVSGERQRAGSIQDPICYSSDFDEIKTEDAEIATGWPVPSDNFCEIAPHQCEVHGHSFTSLKLPQWLRRRVFKHVVLCLVGDIVCISKTREKPIESVVDIRKEPLCLNGNKLTAGSLVVAVPPTKISKWQAVIDSMQRC